MFRGSDTFQFSFLPMHPLLVKNLVWIVLWGRLKALSTVIGVRSRWRSWIRLLVYCNTLLFVSLLWHFYETCHAKTLNFLIMWKKLGVVNSKDPHGKKMIKIIHESSAHTILKVKFLSKNSILPRPKHFHEFFAKFFFCYFFSCNQSCQQLKSPKPQHFHEFFTSKKNRQFSRKIKWIFGQKFDF